MEVKTVQEGDVVQLNDANPIWTGCMMLVENVRSWGVTGMIHGPHGHEYPMRARWEDITRVFRKEVQ